MEETELFLPKFKMEKFLDLEATLKAIGMKLAFAANRADLSGISSRGDLRITGVAQKAAVAVDEIGTEVAVGTYTINGSIGMPKSPPIFRADHPFIFLIRDMQTGYILFMGRLVDSDRVRRNRQGGCTHHHRPGSLHGACKHTPYTRRLPMGRGLMRRVVPMLTTIAVLASVVSAQAAGRERPEVSALVTANNQFAANLYAQLAKAGSGNLFFSPTSISMALTMTAAGARGPTQDEMTKVLGLGDRLDAADAAYRRLLATWNNAAADRGYQLRIANRLWGQKGFAISPDYLKLTGEDYGAEMALLDYQSDPEAARATINDWVARQTEQKIKDLMPPGSIKPLTRLVLTNAIYFKGDWDEQFDAKLTEDADFVVSADRRVRVPMMTRKARFGYAQTPEVQILQMPYKGDDLSMVVVLPRANDGLAALEKSLSTGRLAGWIGAIRPRQEATVFLPKFKLESQFSLNAVLQSMGMKLAFSPGGADFSGISPSEGHELSISDVVHKAYVDVNEEGTEAAAATGAVIGVTSVPAQRTIFRANHPFLFLIRDVQNGSILFLGRVVDPTS